MPFLLKTEPGIYSFRDLQREKETVWDGVTNPQAVKYLREMLPRERLVIYHTGDERTAVGTATVISVDANDPKVPLVRIRCGRAVTPKPLDMIKQEKMFAESPLLRQGRLSVVPLNDVQFEWLSHG